MRPEQRPLPERILGFRRCAGCSFDWGTGEGVQGCSYYACPYLPEELWVSCDWCGFNFVNLEGGIRCDHATCERARTLQSHVANYRAWSDRVAATTLTGA